jgi:hypothetical protein
MIVRVLKRLKAAVGYYELGMQEHAFRCIDSLRSLDTIEPFGVVAVILRNEFAKKSDDYISIANALEVAASQLPMPERRAIKLTLAVCFGKGNTGARSDGVVSHK